MPTFKQNIHICPEIFRIILSHIAPVDYLKVKLVSKEFSEWAAAEFKWKDMTKAEVIQGHTSLEAGLPRGRRLKHFICTHCGLVEPANKFSDSQAVKTNRKRVCISCGIIHRTYTERQLPKINGEERIPVRQFSEFCYPFCVSIFYLHMTMLTPKSSAGVVGRLSQSTIIGRRYWHQERLNWRSYWKDQGQMAAYKDT